LWDVAWQSVVGHAGDGVAAAAAGKSCVPPGDGSCLDDVRGGDDMQN